MAQSARWWKPLIRTGRLTDGRLPQLGQTVREVAAELTVALGGVMPAAKSG